MNNFVYSLKYIFMKNKNLIFISMFSLMSIFSIQAQTLTPTVISSAGGFYSSSNAMLSFTVAEMTMVQTFSVTNNILTQGFQQPEDFVVGIIEPVKNSGEFTTYPNPTSGLFTLSFLGIANGSCDIKLYNLVGQIMLTKNISQNAGLNSVDFDISNMSQGIYLLELSTVDLKGIKQINYHKINLVY